MLLSDLPPERQSVHALRCHELQKMGFIERYAQLAAQMQGPLPPKGPEPHPMDQTAAEAEQLKEELRPWAPIASYKRTIHF